MTEPSQDEVEAAAEAILARLFVPEKLPVDERLWRLYCQAAREAIIAAMAARQL
jgi:hypothetical protein